MFAMVGAKPKAGGGNLGNLLDELSNRLRYDAHFSREFFRSIGFLMAHRSGRGDGVAQMLHKRFVQSKEAEPEPQG